MKLKNFLLKNGKEYKCLMCGIMDSWNSKPLSLQIDHIDGNNKNDDLCNLRFLCPNCHSQTSTFSGRNARKNLYKWGQWKNIPKDIWIDTVNNSFSVSETISKLEHNYSNMLIRNYVNSIIDNGEAKLKCKNQSQVIKKLITELQNSKINFNKFGWVTLASEIIQIKPQKVGGWMRRNMPEFYEDNCYKRKLYDQSNANVM